MCFAATVTITKYLSTNGPVYLIWAGNIMRNNQKKKKITVFEVLFALTQQQQPQQEKGDKMRNELFC